MTMISPGDCTLQCGISSSGIMTVNSPSGSTVALGLHAVEFAYHLGNYYS